MTIDATIKEMGEYLFEANDYKKGWDLSDDGYKGVIKYNLSGYVFDEDGLTEERAVLVRDALDYISNITGIRFEETTTEGDGVIMMGDAGDGAGVTTLDSDRDGYIDRAYYNISKDWYGGSSDHFTYANETIIHELGHALGLTHQGDYNGSGSYYTNAKFTYDSIQQSIMSYFRQNENPYVDATFRFVQTYQVNDLYALDRLYADQVYDGKSLSDRATAYDGDTVYGFNSNAPDFASAHLVHERGPNYYVSQTYTIKDTGGIDTIDASGWQVAVDQNLDLRVTLETDIRPSTMDFGVYVNKEGGFSLTKGNLMLSVGTVIENAIGGKGNDTILGNQYANKLTGNDGNDTLEGLVGSDTLYGGNGADLLRGDDGADWIYGGAGSDIIKGGAGTDRIYDDFATDKIDGGSGTDAVYYEKWSGAKGLDINLRTGQTSAGGTLTNVENVFGSNANDVVTGSDVNNVLAGNGGDDRLYGAGGKDRIYGNGGNDEAYGGSGNDFIQDYSGNDKLDGGTGVDTIYAGYDNDAIYDEYATDVIGAGYGNDTVFYDKWQSGNKTLTTNLSTQSNSEGGSLAGVENVSGSNYANDDITGDANSNQLWGNAGNDALKGQGGNDTLYGGAGNDNVQGGVGNDKAYGEIGNDQVFGDDGDDTLYGGAGDDVIGGGAGNDVIEGGDGNDKIYGDGEYVSPISNNGQFLTNQSLEQQGWKVITGNSGVTVETQSDGWLKVDTAGLEAKNGGYAGISQVIDGEKYLSNENYQLSFDYKTTDNLPSRMILRFYAKDADGNYVRTESTVYYGSVVNDGSVNTATLDIPKGALPSASGGEIRVQLVIHSDFTEGSAGTESTYINNIRLTSSDPNFGSVTDVASGSGDDVLNGGLGADALFGGVGNDQITIGQGDSAEGGAGKDTFTLDTKDAGSKTITIDGGTDSNSTNDYDVLDLQNANISNIRITNRTTDADGNSTSGSLTFKYADGTTGTINFKEIEQIRMPCFVRGAMIETKDGFRPVETLKRGDLVKTMDQGYRPISWIGSKIVDGVALQAKPLLYPIRIRKGALGANMPERDLFLSRNHRVLVRSNIAFRMFGTHEILIEAKELIALEGVDYVENIGEVEYFHFMFDGHEIVYADGAPVESFFAGPEAIKSLSDDAKSELLTIFPELFDIEASEIPQSAREIFLGHEVRQLIKRHRKNGKMMVS